MNPGVLGVKLLPWPCNMWQLLPRRSSRKRGGHRLPARVVPVPIILCRLPAAASSARFGDPSGQQIPGFITRERGPTVPVSACASLLQLSLPCARMRRSPSGEERASAPAPPRFFPQCERRIRAPGVHRCHRRQAPRSDSPAPASETRQAAGERGRGGGVEREGGSPHRTERLSLTSLGFTV